MQWPEESRAFLSEVQVELKKVTWPTQRETIAGTVSVVVLVIIMGLSLTAVDWSLSWALRVIWP
jgi:preprotein translocase subunit SecE